MSNDNKLRLWRAEFVHRNGYAAPYQYVEAKKKEEAHKEVQALNAVFRQWPDKWSYRLVELRLVKKLNGKWDNPTSI